MSKTRGLQWLVLCCFILLIFSNHLQAQKSDQSSKIIYLSDGRLLNEKGPQAIENSLSPAEKNMDQELLLRIKEAKSKLKKGINTWNPEHLREAKDIFLSLLMKGYEEFYLFYYLALCDYRLASYSLSVNKIQEAEHYNTEGKKYLEKAMDTDPSFGETYALYAMTLGYEIAFHHEKGMTLGFRIFEYFTKAFEKDPDNPRINLLKGISDLYTPEAYGGGPDAAMKSLVKSVNLFEQENVKDPVKPSWGKDEAYTFLGMAYTSKKEYIKAEEFLRKALEINPNFGLAMQELEKIEKSTK